MKKKLLCKGNFLKVNPTKLPTQGQFKQKHGQSYQPAGQKVKNNKSETVSEIKKKLRRVKSSPKK